jgi:predicted nucleic acid-binding protein
MIAALVFRRRLGWLKMVWANGTVTPLVCRETVHETTRILGCAKFKLGASEQKALLQLYLPFAELVVLPDALPDLPVACRDADDQVFIHLALGGTADFSVTGVGICWRYGEWCRYALLR